MADVHSLRDLLELKQAHTNNLLAALEEKAATHAAYVQACAMVSKCEAQLSVIKERINVEKKLITEEEKNY